MAQCTLGADSGMLASGATAFDVWLHESLCASFDAVLQDQLRKICWPFLRLNPKPCLPDAVHPE